MTVTVAKAGAGVGAGHIPRDPFALRPVAVVDDLTRLTTHDTGHLTLPLHLDGSTHAAWDLTRRWARQEVAETVLTEAGDPDDVIRYVDRDTLLSHWAQLALPRRVRARWEHAHPTLTAPRNPSPGRGTPDAVPAPAA